MGSRRVKVDARTRGNVIEAKWTGNGTDKAWANSPYNPGNKHYNKDKVIDQMRRLKELSYRTGSKSAEYRVSSPQNQKHFEQLLKENFPKELAKGRMKIIHVSGKGM